MHLHIIAFNIPYPPDYGGTIPVFERIKSLHGLGVRIHLHCFRKGRRQAPELSRYCESVRYYKRSSGIAGMLLGLPYIVSSRINGRLLSDLKGDNYPILAEGLHCTGLLLENRWPARIIAIRLHNIESQYYRALARTAPPGLRKGYFRIESKRLDAYEKRIAGFPYLFLTVHPHDREYFMTQCGAEKVVYLPPFIPYQVVHSLGGTGSYNLYHGDLSVPDNERSVMWLVREVWDKEQAPLIIAGLNPTGRLKRFLRSYPEIRLVENPDAEQMERLVREAQVNCIHSFNTSGIKIKLLHALFSGRHCVVTGELLRGTGLESGCYPVSNAAEFKGKLKELRDIPFNGQDREIREKSLREQFDIHRNAKKLMEYLQLSPNPNDGINP